MDNKFSLKIVGDKSAILKGRDLENYEAAKAKRIRKNKFRLKMRDGKK